MSNAKRVNPYNVKVGYGKLFAAWWKAKTVTFSQMLKIAKDLGMDVKPAKASVGVVMSPKKSDKECRGDCRGNYSAMGHIYYADKLKCKKGEEQRWKLVYRKEELEPRTRKAKEEVVAVKAKSPAEAKAPTAKSENKTEATA